MVWQTPEALSAVTKIGKERGLKDEGLLSALYVGRNEFGPLARQKAQPLDVPMAEPTRPPLPQIFEFLPEVLRARDHLHNASRLGLLLP